MENKKLYLQIIRNAICILFVSSILTFLITKEWLDIVATLFGGCLSILGFLSIFLFTHHVDLDGKAAGRFVSAYIFRYLIYFVSMFLGAKAGLNILSMLIGFLCINLAIKLDTFLKRKEEN